jgi:hypothetical protein
MATELSPFLSLEQLALRPGDVVLQTDDSGAVNQRTVKYAPWQLGDGTWVIGLKGIAGGYALCRCQPATGGSAASPPN